jgi:hypothetical protein
MAWKRRTFRGPRSLVVLPVLRLTMQSMATRVVFLTPVTAVAAKWEQVAANGFSS